MQKHADNCSGQNKINSMIQVNNLKKGKCISSSMAKVLIADKKEPVRLFENIIFKIIDGVHGNNAMCT